MSDRHDLERALRRSAEAPAPGPDADFVDQLERRLLAARTTVVPVAARRTRRPRVATFAAVTLALGGAAATAAVVVHQTTKDDAPPAEQVTTVAPVVATSTPITVTGSSTPDQPEPGLGDPGTTVAPRATDRPATSGPAPASTTPTTSAPAPSSTTTTTTEVTVPASMTLSCSTDGSAVHCSWSPGPSGLARYAVLRGDGSQGRVIFVAAGTTSWTDPSAIPGTHYTYVVHAFDEADHSLGHTALVAVTCC